VALSLRVGPAAPTIDDLGAYFVTSDGRALLDVLATALDASLGTGLPLRVV